MIYRPLVLQTWQSLKIDAESLSKSFKRFKADIDRQNVINFTEYKRKEEARKKGKDTLINQLNQVKNKLQEIIKNSLSTNEFACVDDVEKAIELLTIDYLTSQIIGVEYFQ